MKANPFTLSDKHNLARALELARRGFGHTRPNPPVGAVIARGGKILGEGWHRKAGTAHAEVNAIADAKANGVTNFQDATLYVSLEPCSTQGRVGACTDAIAAAGIKRVVYAIDDPNPKNAGRARGVLRQKGIQCLAWEDDFTAEDEEPLTAFALSILAPFEKHQRTGLPFVSVKLAMSLDGKICDNFGSARWISSEASRKETGAWRETVDAIMVGGETVRADNPSLLAHGTPNPDLIRVVVSKSGDLPKDAQLFTDGQNETLVFSSPREAIEELGRRGCLEVLCEGGLGLARSLAAEGLVDEWTTVLCPVVIGDGPLAEAARLDGDDQFVTFEKFLKDGE